VLCAATHGVPPDAKMSQTPVPVVPPELLLELELLLDELLECPDELLLLLLLELEELLLEELLLLEWPEELLLLEELAPPPTTVSDVSAGRPLPLPQNPKDAVPPLAANTASYDSGVTVTLFPLVV